MLTRPDSQLQEDLNHSNQFGEIGLLKNTKYWFKRDIRTIRNSFIFTLKVFPLIFVAISFVLIIIEGLNAWFICCEIALTLCFIILPAVFLVHVMVTKGYVINMEEGTHLNSSAFKMKTED